MVRNLIAGALMAGTVTAGLASSAWADAPPGGNVPVVTGRQWTKSTDKEKSAFLIGVATLGLAEMRGKAGPPSPIVSTLAKNMKGETIGDVVIQINSYYRDPSKLDEPVARVIWSKWGGGTAGAPLTMPTNSQPAAGGMSDAFAKSMFNPGGGNTGA